MSILEILRLAMLDLALHKFRSLLAALGIIFGVASVEGMISISEGARQAAMQKFSALGIDNVLVRSVKPTLMDAKTPSGGQNIPAFGLLRKDIQHVRSLFKPDEVRYVVGLRRMRMSLYSSAGSELDLTVLATEPDYLLVTRTHIDYGRFLVAMDDMGQKNVCVVGAQAARKLFGWQDPLAQSVRVGTSWYDVVGVVSNLASLKAQGGDDIDNCVFIPLATARAKNGDLSVTYKTGAYEAVRVELDGIYLQLIDPQDAPGVADRLNAYFVKTHKQVDYQLTVPLSEMRQKEAEQRIWSIVMGAIAAISLVVGGIGIMNIMLSNVSDRRKEIGTRRAIGANRRDILTQIVLEAATLTSIGGLIGAAVGYGLAWGISKYAQWPTVVTTYSVMLGIVVSCAVGIIFGFWPAWQASKVNPIEALRSD